MKNTNCRDKGRKWKEPERDYFNWYRDYSEKSERKLIDKVFAEYDKSGTYVIFLPTGQIVKKENIDNFLSGGRLNELFLEGI